VGFIFLLVSYPISAFVSNELNRRDRERRWEACQSGDRVEAIIVQRRLVKESNGWEEAIHEIRYAYEVGDKYFLSKRWTKVSQETGEASHVTLIIPASEPPEASALLAHLYRRDHDTCGTCSCVFCILCQTLWTLLLTLAITAGLALSHRLFQDKGGSLDKTEWVVYMILFVLSVPCGLARALSEHKLVTDSRIQAAFEIPEELWITCQEEKEVDQDNAPLDDAIEEFLSREKTRTRLTSLGGMHLPLLQTLAGSGDSDHVNDDDDDGGNGGTYEVDGVSA
jgi:hypothetical protein